MSGVQPFTLSVPDEEIDFLRRRLKETRWPDILTNIAPWEDGTDLGYLRELVAYWATQYDWRAWEARINSLAQGTAVVRGIRLHFVHEPSHAPGAVPLLLLHGWPGSFFEFHKLIPLLKATGRFHIVAPSLPGYGFSSAASERGCGVTAIAATLDGLMAALGYTGRYIAQGGDWGSIVARALALYYPSRCAAIHLNMCVAAPRLTNPRHLAQLANAALLPQLPLALTASEMAGLQAMRAFRRDETGYQKIQGTKPQTLAYALQDSPVGLAAWIIEKFRTWSDRGGAVGPEAAFSRDELLTNICIYWFGGRIASSMRLYKESLANKMEMRKLFGGRCSTPTGVALFPCELFRPPRSWAAASYNLVQWTEMPRGGHFAALEQPQLLADEIMAFADLAAKQRWLR